MISQKQSDCTNSQIVEWLYCKQAVNKATQQNNGTRQEAQGIQSAHLSETVIWSVFTLTVCEMLQWTLVTTTAFCLKDVAINFAVVQNT